MITRTWLVSDACGNTETCSQQVTVIDTTPPVVNCQTNTVVVPLNANCQLVVSAFHPPATDNCTPASQLAYSQSPAAYSVLSSHSQLVTITVTDLCGNSSYCYVTVVGVDRTGPVITGPSTWVVTNCLMPNLLPYVTASDNCCPSSSLHFSQSPPPGLLGPGVNTVTITVTDCNGNTTTKIIHLVISGSDSFLGNLYNTGVTNNGSLLPIGTRDPHYTFISVPGGMPGDHGHLVATGSPWSPWDLTSPPGIRLPLIRPNRQRPCRRLHLCPELLAPKRRQSRHGLDLRSLGS